MNHLSGKSVAKELQKSFLVLGLGLIFGCIVITIFFLLSISKVIAVIVAVVTIIALLLLVFMQCSNMIKKLNNSSAWYEEMLDSIPFPISVTDMKRNWTFINRPVEQMLGVKRNDVLGTQCKNWGANICGTDNCGLNCLERNQHSTLFEQMGGDFQVNIDYLYNNEKEKIGHIEVVQDISKMIGIQKKQRGFIDNVHTMCDDFVDASHKMTDISHSLASGSTEQEATIDDLSERVSVITEETIKNTERANKASEFAKDIMKIAEVGGEQMKRLSKAVEDINEANESINNVINVIEDIASQTNLLSLNASIEAARAGEAGRGFAVVADEVNVLAGRSKEAASDSMSLISNSIEKAKLGVDIAKETEEYLKQIIEGVNESVEMIAKINESSMRQKDEISQIQLGIEQVAEVVHQNTEVSEESANTSEILDSQTTGLTGLLEDFYKIAYEE